MVYQSFINLFVNAYKGNENPIKRWALKLLVGSDRDARDYIAQAWRDNCLILNDGKGKGYYLYNPETDRRNLTIYLAKELKRKQSIEEKLEIGYRELGKGIYGAKLLGSGRTEGERETEGGENKRKDACIHSKKNSRVRRKNKKRLCKRRR